MPMSSASLSASAVHSSAAAVASSVAATSSGLPSGTLVNGALPVVRPNGDLTVLFTVFAAFGDLSGDWVGMTRSTDGAASFSSAARVAALDGEDVLGLRAPPLVSADVDSTGAIHAVWSDCRYKRLAQWVITN